MIHYLQQYYQCLLFIMLLCYYSITIIWYTGLHILQRIVLSCGLRILISNYISQEMSFNFALVIFYNLGMDCG